MPADGEVADGPSQWYSGATDVLWPDTRNSCVETNVGSLLGEVQAAPHTRSGERTGKDLVIQRTFLESQAVLSPLPQWRTACFGVRLPATKLPREYFQEY